jgi:uncharacterized protein (TIGR03435 family)
VRIVGGNVEIASFVSALSNVLGTPIADKTGLTGTFDLILTFAADQSVAIAPPPQPGAAGSTAPTIFTAIQDQLGLKLDASRGPVEVLVIDSVERPTEN